MFKVVVLALVVLVLAAAPGQPGPRAPSRLVVAQTQDAVTLDPNMDTLVPSRNIFYNIFDTLVVLDPSSGAPLPGLASSWKYLSDEQTWIFELRRDITFHNGKPFTAKDVKFTLDRVLDPATRSAQRIVVSTIRDTLVLDSFRVAIRTTGVDPILTERLASVPIASAETFAEVTPSVWATRPVGTGAYRFVSWTKDDRVVLEAHDGYWRGAPKIRQLVFRSLPEGAARVAGLLSGEIDIATAIPAPLVPSVEARGGIRIERLPSNRVMNVNLDTRNAPFNDVRVRRAFNHAINVDEIIEKVMRGYATRVYGLVPPHYFGYDRSIRPYPHDPEAAKRLLREAGFGSGLTVDFDTPDGRYFMDRISAEAIVGYLDRVGVKVNLRVWEWGTFVRRATTNQASPMYLIGWGPVSFDSDRTLFPLLHSRELWSRVSSPRVDDLLEKARFSLNREVRMRNYAELQRLVREEAYFLFLYQLTDLYGVREDVAWKPRPDELLWFHATERR